MRKAGFLIGAIALLAACGDPLAGLQRISEVELAETSSAPQALPSEEEIAREGFFGAEVAHEQPPAAVAPSADLPEKPKAKGGLLGFLRRSIPAADTRQTADDALVLQEETEQNADINAAIELASLANESASNDTAPEAKSSSAARAKPKTGGLFARLTGGTSRKAVESNLKEVGYGVVLPFGEIARSCDSRGKSLGRKVASAGSNGYKLFDTAPASKDARTYYITGFDDGCPRQLTGAHVLLGAPSLYEQLHYGPAGKHLDTGVTDKAYEGVKSKVCGVRKGKPCGSSMKKLERSTFFVSSYRRIDDNTSWTEVLVHDGQVIAQGIKGNG